MSLLKVNSIQAHTGTSISVNTQLNANAISATTYYNLPLGTEVYVTGGTYNSGTATFTNNTGGTFNVSGFKTSDIFVTGGTYTSGTATFTNNTGGTFNVSGFLTGINDTYVTGGTYTSGTATFTNSTGGTFDVTGINDTYVTGGTYTSGTATFTNSTGGTFDVTGINDTYVTGGTYTSGTATFTNSTGGTFDVTGFSAGGGDSYWTSGSTGSYSVKIVNDSTLDATGDYSYAEGFNTTASGNASHAEGNSTTASGFRSHAEGNSTTASGTASHAEGSTTTASGDFSHAEGGHSISSGDFSHAEGYSTTASGDSSHAEGDGTIASELNSHAEGSSTVASGPNSHAEGNSTTASGPNSHAEGNSTTASGDFSHAEGSGTIASGSTSHAEGNATTAGGTASHAEGNSTTASGLNSHAEGNSTTASGPNSHAEGSGTIASGSRSHAEGDNTIASGQFSHAGGWLTEASGIYSFVHGFQSKASSSGAIVLGNGITGSSSNTVFVNNLVIKNLTTGTSVSSIGVDANGKVISGNTNISDAIYTVNADLSAENTTNATTSVMVYGVNVFSGVTATDFATKLPQPVTGKSVKVINNGSTLLHIFPSNVGGRVNNLPIDTPAVIPPDGNLYEFICIKNPLPGEWTFLGPAIGQYDSGEISVSISALTVDGTYNPVITAYDSTRVFTNHQFSSSNWGYNGKNKSNIIIENLGSGKYLVAFRPDITWNGISKIKVYSNLINNLSNIATATQIRLLAGGESGYYSPFDGTMLNSAVVCDNNELFTFNLDKEIAGSAVSGSTIYTSTNIGDAGTLWNEKVAYSDQYNSDVSLGGDGGTFIGNKSLGTEAYPYGQTWDNSGNEINTGDIVDKYYSSFISFQIRPFSENFDYGIIPDFKFRFTIELYQ